jgi:flagellar protein FliS
MSAAPQAYLRTKVLTASPAELRLLLLDGAIRFAEQTKGGYESRDLERALDGTTKCQAILTELMCSLRPEHNPELCDKLAALYTYMYKRMVEASLSKSADIVAEVIGLLQYDRETWSMLMKELVANGTTPPTPSQTMSSTVAATSSPSDPVPGGRLSVRG